tara:strand:- start:6451 stop:6921 length:471 start_codon:yes stop_codon:yes gene_type:complete
MRKIEKIYIHCSATPPSMDVDADTIKKWHTAEPPNGNGWSDIGYHFVIGRSGEIESGRALDKVGAHVKGDNKFSIGICYVGGVDDDGQPSNNMSRMQRAAIVRIVRSLRIVLNTPLELVGHNDDPKTNKACPSFKVCDEFADLVSWLQHYDANKNG